MDASNVRTEHTATLKRAEGLAAAVIMRRFTARRREVEGEQASARIIRRADGALRLQLLAQLTSLLDALQRWGAA